jgi:hypothetical protein
MRVSAVGLLSALTANPASVFVALREPGIE